MATTFRYFAQMKHDFRSMHAGKRSGRVAGIAIEPQAAIRGYSGLVQERKIATNRTKQKHPAKPGGRFGPEKETQQKRTKVVNPLCKNAVRPGR